MGLARHDERHVGIVPAARAVSVGHTVQPVADVNNAIPIGLVEADGCPHLGMAFAVDDDNVGPEGLPHSLGLCGLECRDEERFPAEFLQGVGEERGVIEAVEKAQAPRFGHPEHVPAKLKRRPKKRKGR